MIICFNLVPCHFLSCSPYLSPVSQPPATCHLPSMLVSSPYIRNPPELRRKALGHLVLIAELRYMSIVMVSSYNLRGKATSRYGSVYIFVELWAEWIRPFTSSSLPTSHRAELPRKRIPLMRYHIHSCTAQPLGAGKAGPLPFIDRGPGRPRPYDQDISIRKTQIILSY